jgi:hypothetical protein
MVEGEGKYVQNFDIKTAGIGRKCTKVLSSEKL